jgi:hypothetical protein
MNSWAFCGNVFQVIKTKKSLALIDGGLRSGLEKGQELYVKRSTGTRYIDLGTARVVLIGKNRAAVIIKNHRTEYNLNVGDLIFESENDFLLWRSKHGPDGFMGMRWGTDIRTLEDLDYLFRTGVNHNGLQIYDKLVDIKSIGDIEIENIEYSFFGNRFAGVIISVLGKSNFEALKSACRKKFGDWNGRDDFSHIFFWRRHNTIILLKYNASLKEGMLLVGSRAVYEKNIILGLAMSTSGSRK